MPPEYVFFFFGFFQSFRWMIHLFEADQEDPRAVTGEIGLSWLRYPPV